MPKSIELIVSEILSDKSDYYCHIIQDNNCVGNRNAVIKLFDDYTKDAEDVKIKAISAAIRNALKKENFDVSVDTNLSSMALDAAEGILKRCIIIRTSLSADKI
jgi:hypothetical protein